MAARKTKTEEQGAPLIAFKGFDSNWQCRGFQYEVGGSYTHDGKVMACESGFHACEFPLDVWSYYAPVGDDGKPNRFALVECSGAIARHGGCGDSKVASAQLSVKAEIKIPELVNYAVRWILNRCDDKKAANEDQGIATNTGDWSAATNTGYQSAATNTGDRSAATNTGNQSAATNTGDRSAATNTGYQSAATNTGDQSAATNTGDWSAATNTGYRSAATNTGDWSAATNTGARSAATNTGDQSAATNTGYRSAATNTGDQSAATNTGDQSAATNTGYRSAATNTGDQSAATNTGDWSAATNTGDQSAASVEGKDSVAVVCGYQGRAKACEGSAIVLCYRDNEYRLVHIRAGIAGRDGLKADTWYLLSADGDFVEA